MPKTVASAYKRLKQLPVYGELYTKLCAGVTCENVAEWVQDSCHLLPDVKRTALVRQLYRYRDTIPFRHRQPVERPKMYERVEKMAARVNTLDELTRLYNFQLLRIDKVIAFEDSHQVPYPGLGREMDRAAELLQQIINLKMRLGLIKLGGELAGDIVEAESSAMLMGVMATMRALHGPEATDRLTAIGKKIQESLMRGLPAGPPVLNPQDEIIQEPGGNGKGDHA